MNYLANNNRTLMSDYENNPLLKLVFFCASGYIVLHLVKICALMWFQVPSPQSTPYFLEHIYAQFAIQPFGSMLKHPWTLLTFMFTGLGFFKLVSSLVWLFLFGSVVQHLIGKSEILPLFLVSNIIGGIAFIAIQSVFPMAAVDNMFSGADASVMGFGLGALVLAPKFKVNLSAYLQVPLWLLFLIYLVLNSIVLFDSRNFAYFGLIVAGGLSGVLYMKFAHQGMKLGVWGNSAINWGSKYGINTKKKVGDRTYRTKNADLDVLLDKISSQGIQSLSKEELRMLKQYK